MKSRLISLSLISMALLAPSTRHAARAENWSGWRGPRGDGTSRETKVPVRWNGETGEGVAWKVAVPGEGHASPIVWGDRLFLVSCLKESQERILLCLSARSGRKLWQRTVLRCPLETKHKLNSFASSTPATDGGLVFVAFLEVDGRTIPAPNVSNSRPVTPGRMLVAAYDFEGREKWKVKPGNFISAHGFCSNPVLHEDLVIVNGDHDGDGYLVALDRRDGTVRWKVERENKTRSYATPIIRQFGGRTQMILSGSHSVASYDPRSGRRHWLIDGPTEQFVASMVSDSRLVFLTAGFPERHILAIRPDGHGDVTDSHVVWRTKRGAAYVPSPIVEGSYFLVVSDGGVASCFDTTSGERLWMERIGSRYSASTVSAGELVYFTSDEGVATVVRPGRTLDIVARNKLGDRLISSPAISGGRIYFRGAKHLHCVGATSAVGDGGRPEASGRP
ncbi:MAG: PQQ-binding-like beta-propeller repeat protein [Planctomycetota bacterium]|nr:PQQ-binding-like beta-propeller repeat protein [Planctomycetota bacterium]